MTNKQELFWYTTQCTKCGTRHERTFTPSGFTYAEKYNNFVSSIAPSRWTKDFVNKRCNTCKAVTDQEVIDYAPAYDGIDSLAANGFLKL